MRATKIVSEKDYEKMSPTARNEHELAVRAELIRNRSIVPSNNVQEPKVKK